MGRKLKQELLSHPVRASLQHSARASRLEMSSKSILNNIASFRKILGKASRLWVVLKGNAYGHGLREVLPLVQPHVDRIYVISPQDAFEIRSLEKQFKLKAKPVLVMGAVSSEEVVLCAKNKIEVVLGDSDWNQWIPLFKKKKVKPAVHLHLDTGLGREGFLHSSAVKDLEFVFKNLDVFQVKGFMSHFSNTEDVTEQSYAQLQVRNFKKTIIRLKKVYSIHSDLEEHIAASAAALVLKPSHLSCIRMGISLYGIWPSMETKISTQAYLGYLPSIQPVLTWKCRSQMTKSVSEGSYIGYGCTYRCTRKTRIAVFPVGYFDGYPRLASGKAHVLIDGHRCPVLGRVMMNHLIVDVTQLPQDDEVFEAVLLGRQGDDEISADMLGSWAQTISYETVTRIGAHLKRQVV